MIFRWPNSTRLLIAAAIAVCCAAAAYADTAQPDPAASGRSETKEGLMTRLKTDQAQLDLDSAKANRDRAANEYNIVKGLFEKNIVEKSEERKAWQDLEQATLRYRQAEIDLKKTRLGFLTDATLVTVVSARKVRSEGGRFAVTISLQNDSNLRKARIAMQGSTVTSDEQLAALLDIDNVIVTLIGRVTTSSQDRERNVSTEEAIVGDPYQHIVPLLRLGQTHELSYDLLKQDIEAVTIRVEYLGTKNEYPVFLMKGATEDLPTISSTQYAQNGQLGQKIRYDIELEALGTDERSYSLLALNLPTEIPFAFIDPDTDASVTSVKFTDEISKRSLDLELSIPAKLDQKLVGSSISFEVFVIRPQELRAINDLRKKYADQPQIPAEGLAMIKGNRVELVLGPRGVGKLEIVVANAFKEVQLGQPVNFTFTIHNAGTLALRKVTPELDLPLEWQSTITPKMVAVIDPDDKTGFTADITPPPDVVLGTYSIKIKAEGSSGVDNIEGLDKLIEVKLKARSNITGTLILVFVLIALVVILAVATVKISRR